MKKNNNTLGKIALVTAAVGLGTYVYKKFMDKNSEKDETLNSGVVEIEDLEDISCDNSKEDKAEDNGCCCGSPSKETESSFEIKLDNLKNEESNSEEDKKEEKME